MYPSLCIKRCHQSSQRDMDPDPSMNPVTRRRGRKFDLECDESQSRMFGQIG